LTKDGWLPLEMTIRALEQSGGADLLSAPSVTTADGKTAEIWVGDREKMPAAFKDFSQNTSVAVEYQEWNDINLGVHLEVTPELKKDGLIDLELKPEVIELVDFDSYGITPDNASMLVWAGSQLSQSGTFPILNVPGYLNTTWQKISATLGGGDPNTTNNLAGKAFTVSRVKPEHEDLGIDVPQTKASLPILRVRKIQTNLTVADGSTVGMGGLIYDKLETYKDKVPVLGSIPLIGRLFRSEGERSVKRNLMIFVTATKVDVNGRRSADQMVRN
jgi:type II secretory pathway component GspD/PulD (secretin)